MFPLHTLIICVVIPYCGCSIADLENYIADFNKACTRFDVFYNTLMPLYDATMQLSRNYDTAADTSEVKMGHNILKNVDETDDTSSRRLEGHNDPVSSVLRRRYTDTEVLDAQKSEYDTGVELREKARKLYNFCDDVETELNLVIETVNRLSGLRSHLSLEDKNFLKYKGEKLRGLVGSLRGYRSDALEALEKTNSLVLLGRILNSKYTRQRSVTQ